MAFYAAKNNNTELKEMMHYTMTDLYCAADAEALNRCNIIHKQAGLQLTSLTDFGITSTSLTDFRTVIDEFDKFLGKRRGSVGTQVAATQELEKLFAQANALLKDVLDKLMIPFKTSDPTLYSRYLNARQVISLGTRHRPNDNKDNGEVK